MTAAPPPADELDKYIAHTMDCETVMLEGYPCICGSIAAIAAYSRTQTEAVLERLRSERIKIYGDEYAIPLAAIDAEIARLRGEA